MIQWLLMGVLTQASLNCPKFKCVSSGTLESGLCIGQSSGIYYISPCTDYQESYCPPEFGIQNVSCEIPPVLTHTKYPGEKCIQDTDCLYGTCTQNVCLGQSLYSNCQAYGECNPGLKCPSGNGKCVPLGSTTDTCDSDYDCLPDLGCDDGYCKPYYSVNNGEWINNCTDGESNICKSGQCLYGYCIEGLKSQNVPMGCGGQSDCVSFDLKDEGIEFFTNCTCGYNTKGQSYCYLFPGDDPYVEYIKIRKQWIDIGVMNKCNTIRRWSFDCMVSQYKKSFAMEYIYKEIRALYYPMIYGMDDCVGQVAYNQYYQADQSINNLAVWNMLGLGLLSLLV